MTAPSPSPSPAPSSPSSASPGGLETAAARADGPALSGNVTPLWQLRLLGAFELADGVTCHTRLGTRAAMALLARLALRPGSAHPRETLVELLWPEAAPDAGRQRLRQTLSTLKQVLEPPTRPGWRVIDADRLAIRLVPGALACDALAFDQACRRGAHDTAQALYRGDLLPGFYDEWIGDERLRLEGLYERLPLAATPSPPHKPHAPSAPRTQAAPPAPPAQASATPHSPLPAYLTRMVGADPQAARLRDDVLQHRLVTLLGAGGAGKTRLAVEVAQALQNAASWPVAARTPGGDDPGLRPAVFDTVAFVPLAACRSRAEMHDQLLLSLRITGSGGGPLDALVQALDGRRVLLVLDNFEQLVDAATDSVAMLAARLPQLHQLVTSRRALGLPGEREFGIATLPAPAADAALHDAALNPAVALFVDRARAARAEFHLHAGNCADVVALVQLLDGMPLAIELAAARVRSLAPADMVATLRAARGDRSAAAASGGALALLARSPARGRQDTRQHSMHDTIAWSWALLDAPQRQLLAALTVFTGGFTVAAVQAVCAPHGGAAAALDELLQHSLLRATPADDGSDHLRFTLYEPVREFAHRALDAAQAAALRAHHRAWALAWCRAMPATPSLPALRTEWPNLLAAMADAVAAGDPACTVEMALALRPALDHEHLPAAGEAALHAALPCCSDATTRSMVLVVLGLLWFRTARGTAARAALDEAVALAPASQPAARARALVASESVAFDTGDRGPALRALLDEAQALAQAAGDVQNLARVATGRATLASQVDGDMARAAALHQHSIALWQSQGNELASMRAALGLAQNRVSASLFDTALAEAAPLIARARQLQFWRVAAEALHLSAAAHNGLRQWPQARSAAGDSIAMAWRMLESYSALRALWTLLFAIARSHPQPAQQLAGAVSALWLLRFGRGPTTYQQRALRRTRRLARAQFGAKAAAAAFCQGQQMTLPQAVALAMQVTAAA